MTTRMHAQIATAVPPSLPSLLVEGTTALRGFAQRVDAWLAGRKRVAADRDALARMSDRELIDIGVNRASVRFVAEGGRLRDCPF